MQMLMHGRFPVDRFNAAVCDGSAGEKLQWLLQSVKPTSAYFTANQGQRGRTLMVAVDDPSDIPSLAEPFFLMFDAKVQFEPFMTPEDLARAGLDALGKEWG